MNDRSQTDSDGWNRQPGGRFGPGNKGGPGSRPLARKAAALRAALLDAVSEDDLRMIVMKLVSEAKGGSIQAAHEVLDRVLGKPEAIDLAVRIAELEELLEEIEARGTVIR